MGFDANEQKGSCQQHRALAGAGKAPSSLSHGLRWEKGPAQRSPASFQTPGRHAAFYTLVLRFILITGRKYAGSLRACKSCLEWGGFSRRLRRVWCRWRQGELALRCQTSAFTICALTESWRSLHLTEELTHPAEAQHTKWVLGSLGRRLVRCSLAVPALVSICFDRNDSERIFLKTKAAKPGI